MRRQVLLEFNDNLIPLNDVDDSFIYASIMSKVVCIIIKLEHEYRTTHLYADELQNDVYQNDNFKGLIKEILEDGYKVFEFAEAAELFEWIDENKDEIDC